MLPISGPITTHSLLVGQAWSTVFELYFYSLFALLLFTKTPRRYIVHLIILLCIVGYGYRLLGFPVTGVLGFLSSIMGSKHIIFFLEGVILAIYYEKGCLKQVGKNVYFVLFLTLLSFYVWLMTNTHSQVYSILISPCVFIGVLVLNNYVREESWWNKSLSFCGDISFSIYLVHILIIKIIMNNIGIENWYALTAFSLILTMMISAVIYLLVEKRFINLAKQLVNRRKMISKKAI